MFWASLPLQNTQIFCFGLRMGGFATVVTPGSSAGSWIASAPAAWPGRVGLERRDRDDQNGGSSAYPPEPAGGAEPHGSSGGADGPPPKPPPPPPPPLPRFTLLTFAVA